MGPGDVTQLEMAEDRGWMVLRVDSFFSTMVLFKKPAVSP